MPYIRKLPSGRFQATVRHPSGKRIPKTFPLRRQALEWGRDLEAQFRRGELRDPRAGHILVEDWYERWAPARGGEPGSRDKTDSLWRVHAGPQWGEWPMDSITRLEAEAWVRQLVATPAREQRGGTSDRMLSAATVQEIVHLMSSLYAAALAEQPPLVLGNPFANLKNLPRIPPSPIDFYTHEEADALLEAIDSPVYRALVEVGLWVGLRPGELFGLAGTRVDWLRGRLEVTQVMTRHGLRDYPKTRRSHRMVPVPPDTMDRLRPLMAGRALDSLLFTTTRGTPVTDTHLRHRVWDPAVRRAGIRHLPPRAMRHTAASWLVMDGVDLYRVQALLGHESFLTTQRYSHLAPDAHDKIQDSWRRINDARGPAKRKASG